MHAARALDLMVGEQGASYVRRTSSKLPGDEV